LQATASCNTCILNTTKISVERNVGTAVKVESSLATLRNIVVSMNRLRTRAGCTRLGYSTGSLMKRRGSR